MTTVSVPWGMWYSTTFDMTFPDSWQVLVARMRGGDDIGEAGICEAFDSPIGSPPLRELAAGRRDAAILIDDLTRPTPAYRIVPYILQELAAAGLGDDRVRIVCAVGCHRAMTRHDQIKKLGLELVERLHVINHNAYDNLEFYGQTSQGVPLWINRDFGQADVKIAAGMISPRGPFFSGGAKLLLPGVCGRQTISADHSRVPPTHSRAHAAEAARMVGLDFIANPLLNPEQGIIAMVTGDPEQAYRHGIELAQELYATEVSEAVDVVICNAWPKDTEGARSAAALHPLHKTRWRALNANGTVVITTASSEGLGYHSLLGPGTRLRQQILDNPRAKLHRVDMVYSPNLHREHVRALYGDAVAFCRTWPELLARLEKKHGQSARVCVFPCGAMQEGVPAQESMRRRLLRSLNPRRLLRHLAQDRR